MRFFLRLSLFILLICLLGISLGSWSGLSVLDAQSTMPSNHATSHSASATTQASTQPATQASEKVTTQPSGSLESQLLSARSTDGRIWVVLHDFPAVDEKIKSRLYVGMPASEIEEDRGLSNIFSSSSRIKQIVAMPGQAWWLNEAGEVWTLSMNRQRQLTTDPAYEEPYKISLPKQAGVILQVAVHEGRLLLLRRLGSDPEFGVLELLFRNGNRWDRLPLPGIDLSWRQIQILSPVRSGSAMVLKIGNQSESVLWVQRDTGNWVLKDQELMGPTEAEWYVVDQQVYHLITQENQYQLSLWRQGKWWNLESESWPEGIKQWGWSVGDGQVILTALMEASADATASSEDPQHASLQWWPVLMTEGSLGESRSMTTQVKEQQVHIDPIFIATLAALLLSIPGTVLLWLGKADRILVLPEQWVVAGLMKRGLAFVIDILPAIGLSMLIFQISDPAVLLQEYWPSRGVPVDKMVPGLVCMGIWTLHTLITEIIFGMTLGKRILGLRVLNMKGQKADALSVIYRNAFKPLELIGFLLLIMPFFTRSRQRIGDFASKTVVVMKRPEGMPVEGQGSNQNQNRDRDQDSFK